MTCTNFPSAGLVIGVTTHQVGEIIYLWSGVVWEAISVNIGTEDDVSVPYTFKTVALMQASTIVFPVGKKIFWQGYYTESDGGSNWGLVTSGAHTDDGGSVFTLADGQYIAANLKGESVNVFKFGAKGDSTANDTVSLKACIAFTKVKEANITFTKTDGYYRVTEPLEFSHKSIVEGNLAELSIEHSIGDGVKLTTAIQFQNFSIVIRDDAFNGWALNADDVFDVSDRNYPSQLHINNIYMDSDTTTYNANMLRFSPYRNYGAKISRIFMGRGTSTFTRRCNNAFQWYQTDDQWGTSNIVSEIYIDMNIQGDYWTMTNPDIGTGGASSNEIHSVVIQTRNLGTVPVPYGYLVYVNGFTQLRVTNFKLFDYIDGSQYAKPVYYDNCTGTEFSTSPDVDFTRLTSDLIEIGSATLTKRGYSTRSANSTVNTNTPKLETISKPTGFAYPYFFPTLSEYPLDLTIRCRVDFAVDTRPLNVKIIGQGASDQEFLSYHCRANHGDDKNPVAKVQLFREGVVVWLKPSSTYLMYDGYGAVVDADGETYTNVSDTPVVLSPIPFVEGLGQTRYAFVSSDVINGVAPLFAVSSEMLDATSKINTVSKAEGNSVYVTDDNKTVTATNAAATFPWVYDDGTVAYTPT